MDSLEDLIARLDAVLAEPERESPREALLRLEGLIIEHATELRGLRGRIPPEEGS